MARDEGKRGMSGGARELQAELRDAGERCGLSALRDAAGRVARCGPKQSRPGLACAEGVGRAG